MCWVLIERKAVNCVGLTWEFYKVENWLCELAWLMGLARILLLLGLRSEE